MGTTAASKNHNSRGFHHQQARIVSKTDETSERQWDDVTRLIQLLGSHADVARLAEMAESVGVDDLLKRLLNEKADTKSRE